ncbi:GNAT family N-acetyltransferase [Halobacillus massiliensis]|uniref:GNAT family N-acetyltransferase n=1 Tax=Halobacillus massiliensis TaxID=1926286 RepID=UPI0009E46C0A|nr:GNAT family N-acetyltransferase [Halobacillus massiliensis]
MISVITAVASHIEGIRKVCIEGNKETYQHIYQPEYLNRVIKEYYNKDRILKETTELSRDWGGYFVALDGEDVVGAAGGGMTGSIDSELYVLYLNPNRRNEGIGTLLLEAVTRQQKEWGAETQWVSVQKGNDKGIPFYEARGFSFDKEEKGFGTKEDEEYISLRYKRMI